MRIYTKTGDAGETGIQGGRRISKSEPRIRAYGALDEANAILGIAVATEPDGTLRHILESLQRDLFVLGADLSNPDMSDARLRITSTMTENLEKTIDDTEESLEPLTCFVLPGGGPMGSHLHHARTVVRRAETEMASISASEPFNTECLRYVNRLSDLLFVLARAANMDAAIPESPWTPEY